MVTGPLVFRPRWFMWTTAAAFVVNGLLNATRFPWALAGVPIGLVALGVIARLRTEVDDLGITSRRAFSTSVVPWRQVVAIRNDRVVKMVTRSGAEIPLPNVDWRARVPSGHVNPRSAQAIVERARAAGFDVALDDRRR